MIQYAYDGEEATSNVKEPPQEGVSIALAPARSMHMRNRFPTTTPTEDYSHETQDHHHRKKRG